MYINSFSVILCLREQYVRFFRTKNTTHKFVCTEQFKNKLICFIDYLNYIHMENGTTNKCQMNFSPIEHVCNQRTNQVTDILSTLEVSLTPPSSYCK